MNIQLGADAVFVLVSLNVSKTLKYTNNQITVMETKTNNKDVITFPSLQAKKTIEDDQISSELSPEQVQQARRMLNNFP